MKVRNHLNDKEFRQWQAAVALQYGIESVPIKDDNEGKTLELCFASVVTAEMPRDLKIAEPSSK
jgi:hypothetical protein